MAQGSSNNKEQAEGKNGPEATALVAGAGKGNADDNTVTVPSGGRKRGGKKEPPWIKDAEFYHCGEMGHTNKFCPVLLAEQKQKTAEAEEQEKDSPQKCGSGIICGKQQQ